MKLALSVGYSGATMTLPVARVQRAEQLGFDAVWTAEAYGSDAFSPLAYLAAVTTRIKLGTGIIQLAARTPANAAMTAATIDALAGGNRLLLGIGVSGPQIVEGWYGQPWGRPYHRVKDYVAIIRKILRREAPVTHAGSEIAWRYRKGGGGTYDPGFDHSTSLELVIWSAPLLIIIALGALTWPAGADNVGVAPKRPNIGGPGSGPDIAHYFLGVGIHALLVGLGLRVRLARLEEFELQRRRRQNHRPKRSLAAAS